MLASIWDKHDFLADLLERSYDHESNLAYSDGVKQDLILTCGQILQTGLNRDVYDNLLDPAARMKMADSRHFAWASQAIFHGHACAVGQRILTSSGRSPLVEQIQKTGSSPTPVDIRLFKNRLHGCKKTLDVMIHERSKYFEVILIQGYTLAEARRISRNIRPATQPTDLFGNKIVFLENARARTEDVRSLLLARDLISAYFPNKTVTAVFMIVDGPDSIPNFQAFNLTSLDPDELSGSKLLLDGFEPCYSSLDERQDTDAIQERLDVHMLKSPPLERGVRLAHLLRAMYESAKERRGLYTTTLTDLGRRVADDNLFHYEENLLRHDFEDGLERRGYVRRLWLNGTRFALSPKGMGKASLISHLHQNADARCATTIVREEAEQVERLRGAGNY